MPLSSLGLFCRKKGVVDARFCERGHVFDPDWIVKTAKSLIIAFISALRSATLLCTLTDLHRLASCNCKLRVHTLSFLPLYHNWASSYHQGTMTGIMEQEQRF